MILPWAGRLGKLWCEFEKMFESMKTNLPVWSDPETVGQGRVCFKGTRVPVDALFENLEAGLNLAQLLEPIRGVSPVNRLWPSWNTPGVPWMRRRTHEACAARSLRAASRPASLVGRRGGTPALRLLVARV